jgi:quercetin dioxygenase-like cupin family protein
MTFYRFEKLKSFHFNPHLSSVTGPIIEGDYMYFRRVKKPGRGKSTLHYHPNEFMAFMLEGKINAVVGSGRRVAGPGTLVHIPSNVQHQFKSNEDVSFLYIKDRTWTMIGAAADEALPEKAKSATEVARDVKAGRYPGGRKDPAKSQAIVDGVGNCFYPMIDGLDAPAASGHCERWLEGSNIAFGFMESPSKHTMGEDKASHELFAYLISGTLDAFAGKEQRRMRPGDVMHAKRGMRYGWEVRGRQPARLALVRSTTKLEAEVSRTGASDNWRG